MFCVTVCALYTSAGYIDCDNYTILSYIVYIIPLDFDLPQINNYLHAWPRFPGNTIPDTLIIIKMMDQCYNNNNNNNSQQFRILTGHLC